MGPVVPHDEIRVSRKRIFKGFQAEVRGQTPQVGFRQFGAVHQQRTFREDQALARQPDDPLQTAPLGHRDNNDIASPRL